MSRMKRYAELKSLADAADFTVTDRTRWETYVPQHIRDDWDNIPSLAKVVMVEVCEKYAEDHDGQL